MRYLILFILSSYSYFTFAQKIELKEVQRINLIDYQNNSYDNYYLTEYTIILENNIWKQYQTKQDYFFKYKDYNPKRIKKNTIKSHLRKTVEKIFLRNIPRDSVQILLNYINESQANFLDLRKCGIDSTWIQQNADIIYNTYLKKRGLKTKPNKKLILEQIYNQELYYNFFTSNLWIGDYPTCAIQIISKEQDTLHIVSHGQKPFMMPWQIYKNQEKVQQNFYYNPFISKWLGSLVKLNGGYSNKKRLLASNLDQMLKETLVSNIYYIEYSWITRHYTSLDSLKIGLTKSFYSNTQLRKWEVLWNVKFIKKSTNEYLQIMYNNNGLKLFSEFQIILALAYKDKIYQIQKDIKKTLSKISEQNIFTKNSRFIDSINVIKDKDFVSSSTLRKDYKLLGKKMPNETFYILEIYEKNGQTSY